MTKITYIPGEIANAAIDKYGNRKPVTRTHNIFDDNKNKNQAEVNVDVDNSLNQLSNEIDAVNKQNVISVDTLPDVSTADPKKIYRVVGDDNYVDYMVNSSGDDWKKLATYNFPGMDDKPTAGSNNLVKSDGVFSLYHNIQVYNSIVNNDITYKVNNNQLSYVISVKANDYIQITSSSRCIGAFLKSLNNINTNSGIVDISSVYSERIDFNNTTFVYYVPNDTNYLLVNIIYDDNTNLIPNDIVINGISYLKNIRNILEDILNNQQRKGYNKLHIISTLQELNAIEDTDYYRNTYFILSVNLYGNVSCNLPKNCTFDFNGHTIGTSTAGNLTFISPVLTLGTSLVDYPILKFNIGTKSFTSPANYTPFIGYFRTPENKIILNEQLENFSYINRWLNAFFDTHFVITENVLFSISVDEARADYGLQNGSTLEVLEGVTISGNTQYANEVYITIKGTNTKVIGAKNKDLFIDIYPNKNLGLLKCEIANCLCRTINASHYANGTILRTHIHDNEIYDYNDSYKTNSGITNSILASFHNGSVIESNHIHNMNYGIKLNCSVDCVIQNNLIENISKTGVILIGRPDLTCGFDNELYYRNENHIIRNNTIKFAGEESLSIDCYSIGQNSCVLQEIVLTSQTCNNRTTSVPCKGVFLLDTEDTNVLNYKNGCFLISISKKKPLYYYRIKDIQHNSGSTYTIEFFDKTVLEGFEVGDRFIIANCAYNNKFMYNTIISPVTSLCIYGNAIKNIFKYNNVVGNNVYVNSDNIKVFMITYMPKPYIAEYKVDRFPIIDNEMSNNIFRQSADFINKVNSHDESRENEGTTYTIFLNANNAVNPDTDYYNEVSDFAAKGNKFNNNDCINGFGGINVEKWKNGVIVDNLLDYQERTAYPHTQGAIISNYCENMFIREFNQ